MTVGVYTFELHLSHTRSLKEKRQVVRSLKERLRSRHNVAVSEFDHSELWQRAGIAVVSVADRRETLDRLFEAVYREAELATPGQVVETGRDFIEGSDGGPGGWDAP